MARGKTLTSILNGYRAAARLSLNPAHNNQNFDTQLELIQRVQEWLWEDFTWPHLRVERRISLQAGQRYYEPPEDIAIDRIEKIEVRFGQEWTPLKAGISAGNYSQWDSDLDERSWPVSRWKISEDEQIEVWPVPDYDGDETTLEGVLKVTGIRKLQPLIATSDRADLDDRLIISYAAAETLAAMGAKDAQIKLSQANKLYARLRGNLTPQRKFSMFGLCQEPTPVLHGPPRVYYRTTED